MFFSIRSTSNPYCNAGTGCKPALLSSLPPFPCDISPVILFTGGCTWCLPGCWSGLFVVHRGFSNPRERAAAGLCPSPPILIRLSYWVILRIFFFCCTLRCQLHQGQKQAAGRSRGSCCCCHRSEENRDSQALSDRSVFRSPEFRQQPSCRGKPCTLRAWSPFRLP